MFDTPVNTLENEVEVAEALTNFIVQSSLEAIEARGRFALAVTAGRAFSYFASIVTKEPFLSFIDWTKWFLFFVDERCVSLTNPCSNYKIIDELLLRHVNIPEMQVFPAFDPSLQVDEKDNTSEPAAATYESQIRAALGEEGGLPVMDVILFGVDEAGNVGSFFPKHEILKGQIRNHFKTWGATEEYRDLAENQAVTAMYDCPLELIDISLTEDEWTYLRRRGLDEMLGQRVSMTVKMVNKAREIIITCCGSNRQHIVKDYFEGPPDPSRSLNCLLGEKGRPKMFVDKSSMALVELPQLLRGFQVTDIAYRILERETSSAGFEDSDDEEGAEQYNQRVLEAEEQEREELLNPRQPSAPQSEDSESSEGEQSRGAGSRRRSSVRVLDRLDSEDDEKEENAAEQEVQKIQNAPRDGDIIVPDDYSQIPEAVKAALSQKRAIFVRSGHWAWGDVLRVDASLEIVGEISASGESPILNGRWQFSSGSSGLLEHIQLCLDPCKSILDSIMTFEANAGPWTIQQSVIRSPSGKCIIVGGESKLSISQSKIEGESENHMPRSGLQIWDKAQVELQLCEFSNLINALNIFDASSLTAHSTRFNESNIFHMSLRDESIGIFVDCNFLKEEVLDAKAVLMQRGIIWASKENAVTLEMKGCNFPTSSAEELWQGGPKPHVFLAEESTFHGKPS